MLAALDKAKPNTENTGFKDGGGQSYDSLSDKADVACTIS
jgi:hypothetical protein